MNPFTILIVDDERTLARSIKLFLAEQGYEAEVAENADKALELLDRLRPDLVFLDVSLPGMSGIELLKRIKEFDRNIAVAIMTAYGSIEGAVEAVKLGAFDYIKKPVDLDELKLLADRAREISRMRQELSYYREREVRGLPIKGIIGKCEAILEVIARVQQIAALEESPPILITGETGTGKGLVARTLHSQSRRASRPFIEVNCTALPGTLMEAELFGYERGAFTDAKESKMGLFEAADGGFLFLDEVGDIELSLQGKLLRAIEEGVIRRIGGLRDRRVDVNIVAATHLDLEEEVKAGRFRKDLYYRLAVITIDLPPLRERGEDILMLATHYLDKFNAKYGKAVRGIDDKAVRILMEYPWPGNVRELSHVIERAVLWSQGERLAEEQLALATSPQALTSTSQPPPIAPVQGTLPPEGIALAEWERSLIEQALRECAGNQTKAAKRLGISRDTLRYRLKKYGLSQ
ncbi:MAG: sigma-54-dependent Fis family transcriptional regulator [candidate division NC10 bacterium]|nr:sigma-54-dependent Fis family transcriptional regulator [candidate division NC10 bacterium]